MPLTTPHQIEQHIDKIMSFYHPRCIDPQAGFYHYLTDDGHVYNRTHRHLVSSARYVIVYARYAMHSGNAEYLAWARHGLKYLEESHYQTRTQGYAWTLDHGKPDDTTQHCQGLACVLLAYATALKAGIPEARGNLYRVHELQTRRFFEPHRGLYASTADEHWHVSGYRGQSANMHSCEALVAAFEATGDRAFVERAFDIARALWLKLAPMGNGWLWEHYDSNWRIDFDYHRDRPDDLFRPWGFQIGHQTEWAKLLVMLARHFPEEQWLVETAERIFIEAVEAGWDTRHGGLVRGVDFNREFLDRDKLYWAQAESLATAAMLGDLTSESRYWRWYDKLANYAWQHMIDHQHGAWYRILTPDNRRYSKEKSPATKTDYHTLGACYEILPIMRRQHGEPVRVGLS
ncbi:AGE family epimerase/isomerase [Salinicola peritrichatus]|uniref:AGE family epimerase/isomerase n=1 Tax=Salinicola peritrichatus TaxID=1267424 RepID=UPI000DA129AC|nr:AGE family epimerase/isomerase [Salinicola peritrichatus]